MWDGSPALLRRAMRRAPLVFGTGAVVGTLGDRIHTHYDVVVYPDPLVFEEAWWVPFLMGGAALLFVEFHGLLRAALRREERPASTPRIVATGVSFGAAYFASGALRAHPVALACLFTGAFAAWALVTERRSAVVWIHAIGLGLFGMVFETALGATGAFVHTSVDVLGVPLWLGPLYLHAALFAREIELRLS